MEYYDESGIRVTNPDITKGSVTEQTRVTGTRTELMEGTEGRGEDGKGLFRQVNDTETVGVYHAYTEEEIAAQKADTEAKAAAEKQQENINALPDQMTQVQTALCDIYEQLLAK